MLVNRLPPVAIEAVDDKAAYIEFLKMSCGIFSVTEQNRLWVIEKKRRLANQIDISE
jgi:hypothetical protein